MMTVHGSDNFEITQQKKEDILDSRMLYIYMESSDAIYGTSQMNKKKKPENSEKLT